MDNLELFKKENTRLLEYESNRSEGQKTELGYRDMNTRFLDLEKKVLSKNDWTAKEREHTERKQKIEDAWHKDNEQGVAELSARGVGSNKNKNYYAAFNLKELECFIKSNNKGSSNSDLYNNVATDLEMYNRIMEDPQNGKEGLTLLNRISESCRTYLDQKNPWFPKGKIRKAIIGQISDKVNAILLQKKNEVQNNATNSFGAFRQEKTEDNVNIACKAHHNMIYQALSGNVVLNDKQRKDLDKNMVEILKEIQKQNVDRNQNDTMTSRYFNSLGWADNKPELTSSPSTAEEHSPLKKVMYHTINCLPQMEDAGNMVKQLAGLLKKDSRQYYSNGIYGKGTYLAVRGDKKDSSDERTSEHCWSYGKNVGSMQVSMYLNGNARMTDEASLKKLIDTKLKVQFPKVYDFIIKSERSARSSGDKECLTMLASFFGFNTIKGSFGTDNIDYYVTTDRKAMTIYDTIFVRQKNGDKDWRDIRH